MPTFLDNSLGYLNNGWNQMYGQPGVGISPATPVSSPPPEQATPVSVNPDVAGSSDMAVMVPLSALFNGARFGAPAPVAYNPEVGAPLGAGPTPIAHNPEVGQVQGADGTQGFWGWLQNLFGGGQQQSPGQPASISAPALNADTQVGPPTPTTPQVPQTTGGDVGTSPGIDAANAANTSFGGGGGMSAGQMGSSILGGIGSGISKIGQGIANLKATYTPPNIPLPQRATFTPPALSPNTKASY